jgi:hypothetical protein
MNVLGFQTPSVPTIPVLQNTLIPKQTPTIPTIPGIQTQQPHAQVPTIPTIPGLQTQQPHTQVPTIPGLQTQQPHTQVPTIPTIPGLQTQQPHTQVPTIPTIPGLQTQQQHVQVPIIPTIPGLQTQQHVQVPTIPALTTHNNPEPIQNAAVVSPTPAQEFILPDIPKLVHQEPITAFIPGVDLEEPNTENRNAERTNETFDIVVPTINVTVDGDAIEGDNDDGIPIDEEYREVMIDEPEYEYTGTTEMEEEVGETEDGFNENV